MFLEREDKGGEYELGWKLKRKMSILSEKEGQNDQGKT